MRRFICQLAASTFLLSACLFIVSCNKTKTLVPPAEFAPYITGYTGGLVSSSSSIFIELVEDVTHSGNAENLNKLFKFSPSIKGQAVWSDERTIEFVPNEGELKPGALYEAEFSLGKLIAIEKRLEKFPFSFRVEDRNFTFSISSPDIYDDDIYHADVRAYLKFSEAVSIEDVKKIVAVKTSEGESLTPVFEDMGQSLHYGLKVEKIKRNAAKNIDLQFVIDGKPISIDKKVEQDITIPALGKFRVLDVELISEPQNGFRITFSYPLSSRQDRKGLITISELNNYVVKAENNKVDVYFERVQGVNAITLNVFEGLKNSEGKNLAEKYSSVFTLESIKPQISLPFAGTILPNSNSLKLPFRAVNLKAVDVRVVRIYENNVLMFLQTNSLSGSNELRRSGRLVYKSTFRLDGDESKNVHNWSDYSIDLSGLFKQEPGAIYNIVLSFKQEYSTYLCEGEVRTENAAASLVQLSNQNAEELDDSEWDSPYANYYDYGNYDWNYYDWEEEDNPCHPTYYMISSNTRVSCNVMASNIGFVCKSNSDGKLWVTTSDILTTKPLSGVDIIAYNYQLQEIGRGKTDDKGFATIEPKGKAFVLVAESNKQKTYLKVVDADANSLSRFDTGGKEVKKGLKGYIYGERGVWRPGDTIHVSFILKDIEQKIPQNHPVVLEVFNARGQFHSRQTSTRGVNGFYTFKVVTAPDAPTGLWNVYVKVGGASFHKSLRVETIKPNRLKINFEIPENRIDASDDYVNAKISAAWLTGATARNLKSKVEINLSKAETQFKGYEQYLFNNPATNFSSTRWDAFDGRLDAEGNASFKMEVPSAQDAPGMLRANIICRVFEDGGDASIFTQTIPFSPFESYVGVRLNQPQNKYIETDKEHVFDVVTLNEDGQLVSRQGLEYDIYRIGWSWWWESQSESFSNYINSSSYTPVKSGKLNTVNGKGTVKFQVDYPDWGRYLLYVKDKESGHASGGVVYIDWPEYRGRSDKSDPSGIKLLAFSTDKSSYEVGEEVTVIIPSSAGGNALVALENGSSVISRDWVNVSENSDTKYKFRVTEEMSPNFYIHISLLQPHQQTVNDLPIRMYGVVPVMVSNKNSVLEPVIWMSEVLRPESEFTVRVSEKNNQPMTYTLAVVDEGLLDLTNFRTPNAWNEFYSREALGVRTWDMYDYVIGAFAGKYAKMFSVGGDEDLTQDSPQRANRFKPVVKFIGPFTLKKGDTNKHNITLPMYIGSVRVMVVAGQDNAYGKADKTVPVRSPLMVLSSLPRVISTNEEIHLPINVFAMENSVKKVTINVKTTGKLQLAEKGSQTITFKQPGDDIVYFSMKTGAQTGVEVVEITATGDGNTTKERIEIEVRNPNPPIIQSVSKLLEAGKSAEFNYQLGNNSNDSWVMLETSRIPSVDISRRFTFLYDYQHYCTEQLTSKAFPLLYVTQFKDVDAVEAETINKNIKEAIQKLYGRQQANGGFLYWPGQNSINDWITSYAGNFLVAAKEKGYDVNEGVLNRWKTYQRKVAQNWSSGATNKFYQSQTELQQAYRLYTLALAGSPEIGAMNRMKEMKDLSLQARWRLAATYALAGKQNIAEEIVQNLQTDVVEYNLSNPTYGSPQRDESMILETLVLLGKTTEAFAQARKVSRYLSRENYFNTQSTAFALVAMASLAEKTSGNINFEWTLNGKKQKDVKSTNAIYQIAVPTNPASGKVFVDNKGSGPLFVDLVWRTQPLTDTLPAIANNLRIDVSYYDLKNNPVDINNIRQGDDFVAMVKVSNISGTTDYTDLALTHIIPSGWEIFNERMADLDGHTESMAYTYRDIRDDRVLTYFDLPRGKSKSIPVRLQASYIGSFVLPAIQCEAMYDTSAQARTKAGRVNVVK